MQARLIGVIFLVIILTLVLAWCLLGPERACASEASPSPGASPSASPRPELPTSEQVAWALRWRRAAASARARLCRVRTCFGAALPVRVGGAPLRGASEETWLRAGKRWRHLARDWRAKVIAGKARMQHPGGSGAARWKPLALWVGWPRSSWPTLCYVITRESGGCVRALNASSGCAGLLQIHPCHGVANACDPLVNLRAGLRLYRAAGWQPWGM